LHPLGEPCPKAQDATFFEGAVFVKRVSKDRSLSYMFDIEETFGRLNLYLDHLDMDLSEYLSQAITNEMDACVFNKIGPPKKSTKDKGKDAIKGVEARTNTIDKDKEKVSQDATKSDKSVDYLSPCEEELIELKNRMKANREAKAKVKDNPFSKMNEPNDENNMPTDNVRGETFKEHDIYMNGLLKSLKNADKDGILKILSFLLKNMWIARVVAKCGQRPPRLSDPEKGKQRKQTRYPSASIDELPTCPWRWFYVCFARLADGWKVGCRKIIALYGCFLKSPNQCKILTTIGRDGNNHIYPVAWVVGLMKVVKDVMPNAEHRLCARHIYENFRKQYPGLEFRQFFWAASKASYPWFFNKIIDKIKSANPNAHKYLMDMNPKTWSRAFSEVGRGCEAIENGFS
ncbi:hypothetical protein Tco_0290561, partial [Tanacetum coccineum]